MRTLGFLVLLCLIFGTGYRLWPVFAGMPTLANFFITEDGYLMLTVARNMAIGNGMSVSDGTIPTNGVQPLIAFFFAVPYWITGGDKVTSLIGIHLIHTATALGCVFAIRALAARMLAPHYAASHWPWVVALSWFLGPVLLRHSMNGLETSLITLAAVLTLLIFARVLDGEDGLRNRLWLGVACGLAVLARNDAVFLVAAIFLTWAVWDLAVARQSFGRMAARLVPPGLLSIAVAAPWLLNNLLRFGSIVPVSGTAQSLDIPLGANLPLLPVKLFETAFPMLPIPGGLETMPLVGAICGASIAAVIGIALWRIAAEGTPVTRALALAFFAYAAALSCYYGLLFGAPHFLSRYLAPTAPFLILAALIAALETGRLLRLGPVLGWAYTGIGAVLILGLLMRALLPGVTLQGHEQVVEWTRENLPEDTWAGAVQTGTLGYWHDRTLNLDGKVNPEALTARRMQGSVLDYVVRSKIDVIVDWAGVGIWITQPVEGGTFGDTFDLVLQDQDRDLSVMVRRIPRGGS